ncbi:MAG: hypothetical protein NT009_12055 [Proteobacteria bacterium]|nr:hypothetical protein [Pseudomonadota bacterium]
MDIPGGDKKPRDPGRKTAPGIGRKKLKEGLEDTVILTGLSIISCYPYFLYLWLQSPSETIGLHLEDRDFNSFLQGEVLVVLGASFFSALVGRFFSRRYGLAGLGSFAEMFQEIHKFALLAIILIPIFLFVLDPIIFKKMSILNPRNLWAAAGVTLKSSIFEEIVLRYGVITILAGLLRRTYLAVFIGAVLATLLGIRSGFMTGMSLEPSISLILMVTVSLLLNLFYGYLYASRGLISAMAAHLLIAFKYPLGAIM